MYLATLLEVAVCGFRKEVIKCTVYIHKVFFLEYFRGGLLTFCIDVEATYGDAEKLRLLDNSQQGVAASNQQPRSGPI